MSNVNKNRANLLLITFDQWRSDWGNPKNSTISLPFIHKLAKNGWTAENCYTSCPQCVPARMSWITGLPSSRLGITQNESVNLPGDSPSIIRTLRKKGWTTGIVGKSHWSSHEETCNLDDNKSRLKELGFDLTNEIAGPRALQRVECKLTKDWRDAGVYEAHIQDLKNRYRHGRTKHSWRVKSSVLPNHLYPDIWIGLRGIEMLANMPINKPWLLWISFVGPHEPFDTPLPWKGNNRMNKIPNAIKNNGWINRLPNASKLKEIEKLWENKLEERDIKELRYDYADHLRLLDDQVNKIVSTMKEREDSHLTGVALTSDHGEMLGDHNMLYKSTFLEPSIHVPFIYNQPSSQIEPKDLDYGDESAVGLTRLLSKVLKNLEKGGKVGELTSWCRKQKGAISEFKDEIMFIRNGKKIVFDCDGRISWETDVKNDPQERINTAEQNSKEVENNIDRKILIKWAKRRIKRREKPGWIKIKLEKTSKSIE